MTWLQQLSALMPELYLLMMAIVVLIADLYLPKQDRNVVWMLSVLTVIGTGYLVWQTVGFGTREIFAGHFIADPLAQILKLLLLGVAALAFSHGNAYLFPKKLVFGEYYSLMLFSLLGMMVLVSSGSLLTVYLGLELLSLPLYALIAFDRSADNGAEAAMKYFVLGSLASGLLLYGMSLLFGATGTLALDALASVLRLEAPTQQVLFGLVFVLVGIVFKFGAVPFHVWVPDVYQGAPIAVTAFLASVPKVAIFGMAYRLLVEGMPSLNEYWQPLLIAMALLSIALGNILATVQNDFRRMLAYSAIAHAGFILLGLVAGPQGYTAALYYAAVYALMSVGVFGCIAYLSAGGKEVLLIDDLRGLSSYRPMMAIVILLLMFSLAGIPPLLGFYAKLAILRGLISTNATWVAAVAVLFSVIGAFYYLRVIRVMYFEKASEPLKLVDASGGLLVGINGWLMLLLGIFPSMLFGLCTAAFS